MPEVVQSRGLADSDLINFLTVTAILDRMTDAGVLWENSRKAHDSTGHWLFEWPVLASASVRDIHDALLQFGMGGTYHEEAAEAIHTCAVTIVNQYGGDPLGILRQFSMDAAKTYILRKQLGPLPIFTGKKIFAMWLRFLKDVAGLELMNIERVPLPVDIHIARATYRLLFKRKDRPINPSEDSDVVNLAWNEECRKCGLPGLYPLLLDEPLWLLSRDGCSHSDGKDSCPLFEKCPVAQHCVYATTRKTSSESA